MGWPWDKPKPDQEGTDNQKPVSDTKDIDSIKDEKPEKKSIWS